MRHGQWSGMLLKGIGVAAAATITLTACGDGGNGGTAGEGDDDVTLRFSWWGSDQRIAATEEVIDAFEEENPHITIAAEYTDFQGYWDQLATQAAGGDSPDIMQMDLEYFREYAELGSLLDLDAVETSQIDEDLLVQGHTEGGQFGIPTGFASVAIIANATLFEEAGLEVPDDTTWTWGDFSEVSATIQEEVDDAYGTLTPFEPFAGVQVWLRQHDKELTTAAGELGIEADDLVEYFEHLDGLAQGDSLPPAAVLEEDRGAGADQSLISNSGVGMIFGWSNLYPALTQEGDGDLVLLRLPSLTGSAADNGMWHRASMFLSGSAATEHPDEVQEFIDFFINSEESGLANLTDRGLPANGEVRETVMGALDGAEETTAEFLDEIRPEISEPAPVPPMGFGSVSDIMHRHQAELLFERMTPQEAGESAFAEIESSIG